MLIYTFLLNSWSNERINLNYVGDQSILLACLQVFSISEKFWQNWMFSLVDKHLLKLSASYWHGFWYCWVLWACCWGACSWEWDDPPPMTDRTAWWAISEPAPKAIPWAIMPPNPDNIPPEDWVWTGVWAGMGLVTDGACLGGGAGDDDLPLLEPPLEPPRAIWLINIKLWWIFWIYIEGSRILFQKTSEQ